MELREGYKQTEVGVVPHCWGCMPFGETYAQPSRNGIYKSSEYQGRGTRIVNMGEMFGFEFISNQEMSRVELNARELSVNGLQDGDLLFGRRSVVPAGAGKCSLVVLPEEALTFESSIIRVRLKNSIVHPKFYYYFFASTVGRSIIGSIVSGTNVKGIRATELRELTVPVPALVEQRAIATALSDVDALLAKIDQLIAKKRDLKQAAMQQLLTGQTRLPGFSGEWDVQSIEQLEQRNILRLGRGKVISKQDINRLAGENPIYSSSVHNEGLFGRYGDFMFDEEMITWSVDGGGHFFHRPKHKFSVTNVCGYMRAETAVLSYKFLALQLQFLHGSMKFDYSSKAHPSVIRKAYFVPLPPLLEQTAIATILSDMDSELAALEVRREKTHALKQGMMQALLTGRIRLSRGS